MKVEVTIPALRAVLSTLEMTESISPFVKPLLTNATLYRPPPAELNASANDMTGEACPMPYSDGGLNKLRAYVLQTAVIIEDYRNVVVWLHSQENNKCNR